LKLSQFVPDVAGRSTQLIKANETLASFGSFMKGRYGSDQGASTASQFYGIEQLYFDWLRTAYSYRRMFLQDLYLLAFDSSEVRTPLMWLKNEVFRKGLDEWKPRFAMKCNSCGKEYLEKTLICECGSESLREPDKKQIEDFDKMRLKCNIFGNSFEEVLRLCLDDVNITDDAYIHLNKEYYQEPITSKIFGRVVELRRLHPALMEFDLDKKGLPKNSHFFCPMHRDDVEAEPGYCQICGTALRPAMYIYNHRGQKLYMYEDEIIHFSKFSPSETYGYSPLLTIMQKVLTISGMDRFLYRYFFERKTPTQMILTNTDDPQSLEIERARVESKMMEDPTYTPWIAVSQRTGRGRTDVVKLWHTLQEMDYLPVRNEIRDRISAMYGVPQMYMNVMEGVGGISGQTQQLKVFSSVIQSDQRMFNEKVFPVINICFGITDWEIHLRPPEEKVEGEILTLASQRIQMAIQMQQMGFDIELKPNCKEFETLDFTFSGQAINPIKMQMEQQQAAMEAEQAAMGAQPEEELAEGEGGEPDQSREEGAYQTDADTPEGAPPYQPTREDEVWKV
jgi:hypothetical protein